MGRGRLIITGELMREMFKFPIETTFHGSGVFDAIEIIVSHPDIPETTDEGAELPWLAPSFRRNVPVEFIGWGVDRKC